MGHYDLDDDKSHRLNSDPEILAKEVDEFVKKYTPPAILPCPFCGDAEDLDLGTGTIDREGIPAYVYCGTCGSQGPWVYIDITEYRESGGEVLPVEVLAAWNRRCF